VKRFITGFGLLLFLCCQSGLGQTSNDSVLDIRVIELKVVSSDVDSVLSEISHKYKVPIGLEMSSNDIRSKPLTIEISNGTVRDVLNTVSKQYKTYGWDLRNGVVNVYPKEERDPIIEKVLNARIEEIRITKDATDLSIREQLINSPQVKNILDKAMVHPVIVSSGGLSLEEGAGVSLNMKAVSVRDVLNQIVRESTLKYWVVSRLGNNREALVLNF